VHNFLPELQSPVFKTLGLPQILVWLALAGTIVFGIGLRSIHLTDVTSRSPDERVYTYFARRIANEGVSASPKLFYEYVNARQAWDYPPPTRITTVFLNAAIMTVVDIRDERAGVFVSWLFSCLSLILLAWVGVRLFNPWIALTAVLFMAVSMTELGIARRAWQDTTFGFFSLLLFYVACEISANPRRPLWRLSFFCLGSFLLLTKQTGLIVYGLLGPWLCWEIVSKDRSWTLAAAIIAGGVVSIAVTIGIWIVAAGDTSLALAALDHSVRPGEGAMAYATSVMTAPWHQFFGLLWTINPLTFAMAITGSLVAIVSNWMKTDCILLRNANAAKVAVLITLSFLAFVGFFPGMQELRILSPATGAYCLLAATGVYYLISIARRKLSELAFIALVLVAAVLGVTSLVGEYRIFTSAVVATGMQDLPVLWLRQAIAH
jgi:4-amino-4-deoxy-L-arabinose transferase-like glycosyltransferase